MLGHNSSLTLTLFRTTSDAKLSTLAIDIEPNPPTITPISGISCNACHRSQLPSLIQPIEENPRQPMMGQWFSGATLAVEPSNYIIGHHKTSTFTKRSKMP
jgi:hypothetical protein